jgi:hypothetical protein
MNIKYLFCLFPLLVMGCASQTATITSFEVVRNSDQCDEIPFTADRAAEYFEHATEVTAAQYNSESVILPCYWEGTIESEHQKLVWQINASGAGIIQSEDGTLDRRFLCQTDDSAAQCCSLFPEFCE